MPTHLTAVRLPALVFSTACLVLGAASPVSAESLATSASSAGSTASSAGSASSRGSSDSLRGSSESSHQQPRKMAEGEYRVVSVEPAQRHPEQVTLRLQPVNGSADAPSFLLDLPVAALKAAGPVTQGDRIAARHRSYGLEFARTDTQEPFFLVLADAAQADLQTRVVGR